MTHSSHKKPGWQPVGFKKESNDFTGCHADRLPQLSQGPTLQTGNMHLGDSQFITDLLLAQIIKNVIRIIACSRSVNT